MLAHAIAAHSCGHSSPVTLAFESGVVINVTLGHRAIVTSNFPQFTFNQLPVLILPELEGWLVRSPWEGAGTTNAISLRASDQYSTWVLPLNPLPPWLLSTVPVMETAMRDWHYTHYFNITCITALHNRNNDKTPTFLWLCSDWECCGNMTSPSRVLMDIDSPSQATQKLHKVRMDRTVTHLKQ